MTKKKEPHELVKRGRPTKYNEEIAKEICDELSVTYCELEKLCDEKEHWPTARTCYTWMHKHPEFLQLYTCAQQARVEVQMSHALASVLDDSEDLIQTPKGLMQNNVKVNRANMKANFFLKLAATLNRKKYGEVRKTELTGANGGAIETKQLTADEHRSRVAGLLDAAGTRRPIRQS